MEGRINWRKIGLYILFSFGLSWLTAAGLYLSGTGLNNILSTFVVALFYMMSPAIAVLIVQRLIYKESLKPYGLWYKKNGLKWFLHIPLFFVLLYLLVFAFVALFGNGLHIAQFGILDFSSDGFLERLFALVPNLPDNVRDMYEQIFTHVSPFMLLIIFFIAGIIAGSTINMVFAFGEELGWRGLLLYETQKLGFLKSSLIIGSIWGLWHAPLIMMGHNYPNHPYIGILVMCLFTISITPIFIYIRLKTKSIIGPSIFHGMINSMGGALVFYIAGYDEMFSSIAGAAGILAGLTISVCIFIFDRDFVANFTKEDNQDQLDVDSPK
ncbi:MAG: CPBP family intramembrane glutamic endopeptidase [Dysgonomonas sp.]